MRAVVLRAPGDVGVDTVPDPVIAEPGDAIVEVAATAICGADLFPFHGFTPGFENGTILGHEFTGTVTGGLRRAASASGERVVCTSMISDGTAHTAAPAASRSARTVRSATQASTRASTAPGRARRGRRPTAARLRAR